MSDIRSTNHSNSAVTGADTLPLCRPGAAQQLTAACHIGDKYPHTSIIKAPAKKTSAPLEKKTKLQLMKGEPQEPPRSRGSLFLYHKSMRL